MLSVITVCFGAVPSVQDACIARVLCFVEKHWEELLKFSRRTPRQLEHWAARYGLKERPMDILDHVKKGYHGGRYTCVNLENSATIEFRMPKKKGTPYSASSTKHHYNTLRSILGYAARFNYIKENPTMSKISIHPFRI